MAMRPEAVIAARAAEHARFTRGAPGPDQAPQGEAAQQNEAVAATPTAPAEEAPTFAPEAAAPEAQGPEPIVAPSPAYTPANTSEDNLLFADGDPNVPMVPMQPVRIYDFPAWLTDLGQAANASDANDSTKALFRTAMASPLP